MHGLGEHSGRYAHLAAFLNQAGYTLLAFDLRGHGKSEGQRGHTPSCEVLLDDISGTKIISGDELICFGKLGSIRKKFA